MPSWKYDASKRMYSKHYSTCCESSLTQKMLYKNRVEKVPVTQKNNDDITYRYYCTKCDLQNKGKWEFKHA